MMTDAWETAETFIELLEPLGLLATHGGHPASPDLVFLDVDGRLVAVQLVRMAGPTPAQVSDLAGIREPSVSTNTLHVLVANRITDAVRAQLRSHGWGWLDLRGHIHLAGNGVFVDAQVPPVNDRAGRSDAFSGTVGLEVACELLLRPGIPRGVRELSRILSRSPSIVSEVLSALRLDGLAKADSTAVLPDLFWATANAWRIRDVPPALPIPQAGEASVNAALQLGFDDVTSAPGWALAGTLAAAVYGAPVAARSDYPPDFYVPSATILKRATRLLGVAPDPSRRRANIRIAPVPAVCAQRVDAADSEAREWASGNTEWPLADPLFVALDLATDPGRGREILDGWTPPRQWQRVW